MPEAIVPVKTGVRSFAINGERYMVVGNISYSLATSVREALVGADGFHGHSVKPATPFIEATLRDSATLKVSELLELENAEVQVELQNGKLLLLSGASNMAETEQGTEEGLIPTRWVGTKAEEV